ncbi:MAG: FeoA domain-containing protein [Deltaproteobacteria bacterium]|nr:FeoA domain-containing protein [Deltaproteobacteria bacterium]
MDLGEAVRGRVLVVEKVGGERGFRRRLMELGLVPGTRVEVVSVAPLGDPLELLVRGCSLSIRRREAERVRVTAKGATAPQATTVTPVPDDTLEPAGSGC